MIFKLDMMNFGLIPIPPTPNPPQPKKRNYTPYESRTPLATIIQCVKCNKDIIKSGPGKKYCFACAKAAIKERDRIRNQALKAKLRAIQ